MSIDAKAYSYTFIFISNSNVSKWHDDFVRQFEHDVSSAYPFNHLAFLFTIHLGIRCRDDNKNLTTILLFRHHHLFLLLLFLVLLFYIDVLALNKMIQA